MNDPLQQSKRVGGRHSCVAEDIATLKTALVAARASTFDWALDSGIMRWSGATDILPGQIDTHGVMRGADFLEAVLPASRARLSALLDAHMAAGLPLQTEIEMGSAMGTLWYAVSAVRVPGVDGSAGRITGMLREITEQKQQLQRLDYLAARDELTGLLNRTSLRAELSEIIGQVKSENRHCAFLVIAIDWLGMINDTYGFDAADEVIVEVSQRLVHALRSGDVIGRMAGNKIGVILKNSGDFEVPVVADRLRSVVRGSLIDTHKGAVATTCSIGAVWLPEEGATSSQEAMLCGEEALDKAREHGRDSYYLYRPSPQRESARRSMMNTADELLAALKEQRLVFAYQPIFDARSREILEYECLLRLIREDGTVVSAGQFIPVAEQLGLVRLIDWHALEMVVEQLENSTSVCLSVNVSGTTSGDKAWLQSFVNYVNLHSSVARRLVVELTETAVLNEFEENARFVSQLRELGCRVAIDDFGAGYTSFRNLQKMQVDFVKIDGTYVAGLVETPQNQIFVRTLVDLAKSFDLKIVAEWVSSEEEAKMLEAFGVDCFQGFFLGEPILDPNWQR